MVSIYNAVVTDWENGTIEYQAEDGTIYVCEHAFAFIASTPHMGAVTVYLRNGQPMTTFNMEHDYDGFDHYLAHQVAGFIERYW